MTKEQKLLIQKNGKEAAYYADLTCTLIRSRYSLSEELSLLRRRDEAPEAFADYTAFAEECKSRARAEIYGGDA